MPGGVQGWDRYAYANNNPLYYIDSSGHFGIPFYIGVVVVGIGIAAAIEAYDIIATPPIDGQRAPLPTKRNATNWLTDRLNENATAPVTHALKDNWQSSNPINKAGALKAWVGLVRTNGIWDYKKDIIDSGVIVPGAPNVTIGNQKLNFQAVANITYGYSAQQMGLSRRFAEFGAGLFQILSGQKGSLRTWGDDPFDNYMIKYGYDLAEKTSDMAGSLTGGDITISLDDYIKRNGNPPRPLATAY